jgi:hypothetical protein
MRASRHVQRVTRIHDALIRAICRDQTDLRHTNLIVDSDRRLLWSKLRDTLFPPPLLRDLNDFELNGDKLYSLPRSIQGFWAEKLQAH